MRQRLTNEFATWFLSSSSNQIPLVPTPQSFCFLMTHTKNVIQDFWLARLTLTNSHNSSRKTGAKISTNERYRMGQAMGAGEYANPFLLFIAPVYLGYDPRTQTPVTLKLLLTRRSVVGLAWYEEYPCETAIASTEVVCQAYRQPSFQSCWSKNLLAATFRDRTVLIEVFDLLKRTRAWLTVPQT